MSFIYMLFALAPIVTNLGSFPSLEECERVAIILSVNRHEGQTKDAEIFRRNRLLCVKVNDTY